MKKINVMLIRKVLFILCFVFSGCNPYSNSWRYNEGLPYDGQELWILRLKNTEYQKYMIYNDEVDAVMGDYYTIDGKFERYKDNAIFGCCFKEEENITQISTCDLKETPFYYELHGGYYIIYPLIVYDKPKEHIVTNIQLENVCEYDADTLKLKDNPYEEHFLVLTERTIREQLHMKHRYDTLYFCDVIDYVNYLIDSDELDGLSVHTSLYRY